MGLEYIQIQSEQALYAALSWVVVEAMQPTNSPGWLP